LHQSTLEVYLVLSILLVQLQVLIQNILKFVFVTKHSSYFFLISGFIGVYFVGCILDWTGSWSAVFNITAVINLVGITVFALFGSGVPIV
jgi:hypothetical protein